VIKGSYHTEETKRKMGESRSGIKNHNYGIHLSEETKRKISKAKIGQMPWNKGLTKETNETMKRISETQKGKYVSKETGIKISKANKGRIRSQGFKDKESKTRKDMFLNGYVYSEETRKKLSKVNSGKNNHFWKGGITALQKIIRQSFMYRQWRSDVYTRDNFICQECGQVGKRLNAHHIKSFSSIIQFYEITTIKQAFECEELWNINNGITLCEECHYKLRGEEDEFNKSPDD